MCKIKIILQASPQPVDNNCRACGKVVFQMEQIKAERNVWHKNCFRCEECNKQLKWVEYSVCGSPAESSAYSFIQFLSVAALTRTRVTKANCTVSHTSSRCFHQKWWRTVNRCRQKRSHNSSLPKISRLSCRRTLYAPQISQTWDWRSCNSWTSSNALRSLNGVRWKLKCHSIGRQVV